MIKSGMLVAWLGDLVTRLLRCSCRGNAKHQPLSQGREKALETRLSKSMFQGTFVLGSFLPFSRDLSSSTSSFLEQRLVLESILFYGRVIICGLGGGGEECRGFLL